MVNSFTLLLDNVSWMEPALPFGDSAIAPDMRASYRGASYLVTSSTRWARTIGRLVDYDRRDVRAWSTKWFLRRHSEALRTKKEMRSAVRADDEVVDDRRDTVGKLDLHWNFLGANNGPMTQPAWSVHPCQFDDRRHTTNRYIALASIDLICVLARVTCHK